NAIGHREDARGGEMSLPYKEMKASGLADAAHAVCKRLDVGEHPCRKSGLGSAPVVEAGLDPIDDGGAHDGGIGMPRDGCGLVRRPDAESDGDRQPGMALDAPE